ncbi:agmatine deiminase [Enterococcus phoeniculicola]|jgi:agmatine deiminase|uniref:Putative agmatine deiminase n=1 Tax=Enterococcus phoeniculicola ATCC BAA-412 TaxID=1158610 RepID=R3W2D8_9ENTE|nr:agmatine deiminase [Enterococcus phoeniculicola]EOL41827.1 agmatine deiminase [Enterococcus phoeniculicola ATCC BAA-412]EOT78679.1 agmatine deiminase [Enterococcus phoeniculicola ATCC BAA-412]OJG70395.1 agmatine deiminase [Enterococcus phoeniculicola]
MKITGSSPQKDGFWMPGEFEPHQETYMIWPERADNWRNGGKSAQKAYAEVAERIAEFEKVTMLVTKKQYRHARTVLSPEIRVLEMSNNDAWMKDYGPMYVVNSEGEVRGVDWRFNAWGGLLDGLYFPWDQDDLIAEKICELNQIDYYSLKSFVLEGCSVHTDGEGTLFATEEVLLSEGRNGHLSKDQIEQTLKEYCNIEKIIWLKHGFFLDETNGNIDNLMNVVRPGEVVLTWTEDREDPQYDISKAAYESLKQAIDAKGRKLIIHKMLMPEPMYLTTEESQGVDPINGMLPRFPGDRLTATYVSYYTANGGIVFPLFEDRNDYLAAKLLTKLYPERKIIGVPAREILLGGGNIHCIAQSMPKRK